MGAIVADGFGLVISGREGELRRLETTGLGGQELYILKTYYILGRASRQQYSKIPSDDLSTFHRRIEVPNIAVKSTRKDPRAACANHHLRSQKYRRRVETLLERTPAQKWEHLRKTVYGMVACIKVLSI